MNTFLCATVSEEPHHTSKVGGRYVARKKISAHVQVFIITRSIFAHIFGDQSDPGDPAVQLLQMLTLNSHTL